MKITERTLLHTYTYLLNLPPFLKWGLFPADVIIFKNKTPIDRIGHFISFSDGRCEIAISHKRISYINNLIETMAHEMCHLATDLNYPSEKKEHGFHFNNYAKKVSIEMGFDPLYF